MKRILLLCFCAVFAGIQLNAQCTTANINWDNLDFLVSTGNYATFVTDARTRDQRFAFGPESMRIQVASGITISGENATHTGETGAYGTGEDISFTTTAITPSTITFTFSTGVTALRFSIFDIDNNQDVSVASYNGATPVSTTLTRANGSSANIILGSPGLTPSVDGTTTAYANTSNLGTVNVDVAGSVTRVTLTFATATGDFWISDFQACVPGSFATNYYAPSEPWPGQPAYIIATSDTNIVHMINMVTGEAKQLFTETGSRYVNSLAFDQASKNLYYTPDDVDAAVTQKALKKYNFTTETSTDVVADIATLGIPYFESGVESGGAAFYDGCLYLGVEGSNAGRTSLRESIIWRIEFDGSFNPTTVSQVFAILVDNGTGTLMHDWGDFVVKDGILYNWNSRVISGSNRVHHYNLQTQVLTNYTTSFAPKQNGVLWNGTIYELNGVNLRQYNGTTGLTGTAIAISGPGWIGGSGDGTEAFRPRADFGDAPSIYEQSSPALHEYHAELRLGPTIDKEWQKTGSTSNADSDGADEDAITTVPLLCPCSGNFVIPVRVFNNTGANATVIAWLDYDGDGVFEASETRSATVASNGSLQTVSLSWNNAWTTLPDNAVTHLRIRVTSAANGMTTSMPNGWFSDGEVEDYRVVVDGFPLAVNILSFGAAKDANGAAQINWKVAEDAEIGQYFVQKSRDGKLWTNVGQQQAVGASTIAQYNAQDIHLEEGITYYRLQLINKDGASKLSDIRQITWGAGRETKLSPNPAHRSTTLTFAATAAGKTNLSVIDLSGRVVQTQEVKIVRGLNRVVIDVSQLKQGMYNIQLSTSSLRILERFVKP